MASSSNSLGQPFQMASGPGTGSELSQLLASLGVETSASADLDGGPDPLVVSRSRLTKLKADMEHGSAILKSFAEAADPSRGTQKVAVRLTPPITNKNFDSTKSPPYTYIRPNENWSERVIGKQQGVTYTICENKNEAILVIRNIVLALINHFEALRTKLVAEAQARIDETMKQAQQAGILAKSKDDNPDQVDTVMDEDGRVLNEEGLPFVDPMETFATTEADEAGPASGLASGSRLAKFEPQKKLTGADRKKWIDSVFDQFEGQGDDDQGSEEDDREDDVQGEDEEEEEEKQILQSEKESLIADLKQISLQQNNNKSSPSSSTPTSASATKPLKSVLKPTAPLPPSTPKFGSTGIRRGFLNMNPSSPAAEASSSPVTTPMANHNHEEFFDEASVEKLTKSIASKREPTVAAPPEKAKKHVRIQSPTRSGEGAKKHVRIQSPKQSVEDTPSSSSDKNRHPDDIGVEDEAARIVELLGPTVVKGTPAGDEALAKLEQEEEEAEKQAKEAVRIREEKAKARQKSAENAKPAVGMSVMERGSGGSSSSSKKSTISPYQAQIQQAKASAFKKGFLNSKPNLPSGTVPTSSTTASPSASTPTPVDPRKSMGMSALERSLINDKPLEEQRQSQGLPPAVPHARPSKAYAEKMARRQRGDQGDEDIASVRQDAEDVVVGAGDGQSKVRFQLADGNAEQEPEEQEEEDSEEDRMQGEAELDEHDEEAYVRAAYASGDISDNETGPSSGRGRRERANEEGDSDSGDGSDWNLDSDSDGYNSSDLEDLQPTFDGLVSDLENAELAREYALMKSRQMEARSKMTYEQRRDLERAISGEKDRSLNNEGELESSLWTEEEIDGRHLSSISGGDLHDDEEKGGGLPNKMSRFRASRIVKGLGLGDSSIGNVPTRPEPGLVQGYSESEEKADAAGHDLAHLLEQAQNVGPQDQDQGGSYSQAMKEGNDDPVPPIMILPSLTPLRYSRKPSDPDQDKVEGLTESSVIPSEGIDLEGETDEDENDDHLMDLMRHRIQQRERPQQESEEADDVAARRRKETARKKREEGDGGMSRFSGNSLDAPPSLSTKNEKNATASANAAASQIQTEEEAEVKPTAKVSRFKAARMAAGQGQ
ncbi:unnamed protein product [Sympodiomycopsis kandeliae]